MVVNDAKRHRAVRLTCTLTAFASAIYNAPVGSSQPIEEIAVPVHMELKRIIINEVHDQQVIMLREAGGVRVK